MPKTADSRPIPTFMRSGGNSSRMIPKLSGKTAPAAPDTMRKAISVQMSGAKAQPMQPTRNAANETDEQPLLPEPVAELAQDRRQDGGRQEEAGHDPRHPGRRRVELSLQLGQSRDDHRLLERVRGRGERENAECQSVVLALAAHLVT